MSANVIALRVAAVLWIVWGLVHMFAGVMTVSLDTSAAVAGIADALDPATVALDYPAAAGAIIKQHGWNLGWIGLTTVVCGFAMWTPRVWPVAVAALVGGLADVGYFVFIDLPGYALFFPGRVMTFVSASAVLLSFTAMWRLRSEG